MGAYDFDALQERAPDDDDARRLDELIVSAHDDVAGAGRAAAASSASRSNLARDLQNRPANDLTPTALAERARRARRRPRALTLEVMGRERDRARPAWARSPASRRARDEEPQLITLRYDGPGRDAARCSASSARP